MTSIVVKDRVLEKMSSVSDSEETSQFQEETTLDASVESSLRGSRNLDPPSLYPKDPSATGDPKSFEQKSPLMSYSQDSKGESTTKEFGSAGGQYSLDTHPTNKDHGGNPLKRLLSKPRNPRRQPMTEDSTRPPVSDESSCTTGSLDGEDLAEQYAGLQRDPRHFNSPGHTHRSVINQEDSLDGELKRIQTWIGSCGGDPPGLQKSCTSHGASLAPDRSGHTDNVDNLVLASWGIKNRMDRLRASLIFSPGYSHSKTLASVASTRHRTMLKANVKDSEVQASSFPGDTGAVSSVSESSTYSTFDEELAEFSCASLSDAVDGHDIGKSCTMKSDRVHFRGAMGTGDMNGADTPKSMLAFKSKSWKLGEDDDSQNSLVASFPSAVSKLSRSGNASFSELRS